MYKIYFLKKISTNVQALKCFDDVSPGILFKHWFDITVFILNNILKILDKNKVIAPFTFMSILE